MSEIPIDWNSIVTPINFDLAMIYYSAQEVKQMAQNLDAKYIVQSGNGYLVGIVGNSPHMVSDPVCAVRLSLHDAERAAADLEAKGFSAQLVKLKFGRIAGHAGGRWE